jgi:hypothetical protein
LMSSRVTVCWLVLVFMVGSFRLVFEPPAP